MRTPFFALLLLTGCTLATDAGERKIVDQLDLDFTLAQMTPHAGQPLDVALVAALGSEQWLRARARVILPQSPAGAPFPDERIVLRRALSREEPLRLLFFNDADDNYELLLPAASGGNREHSWINELPASGEFAFTHNIDFRDFTKEQVRAIGGDIVLSAPDVSGELRQRCARALFDARVAQTLEVRIVYLPDDGRTDVGYFKTYRENGLPERPIRLVGIADTGSSYGVDVFVDGQQVKSFRSAPASEAGLLIGFRQWFPADGAQLETCFGPP